MIPPEVKEQLMALLKNWPLVVIVISLFLVAYISVLFMGKNNVVEVEIEKVIKVETGIDVNLTP